MRHLIMVVMGLCMASASAYAQYDPDSLHQVVWATANLSYGGAHVTCDSCSGEHVNGVDVVLALGAVRNQHLRGGVTYDEWRSLESATRTLMFSLYYYPSARWRLFLESGFGGSWLCISRDFYKCPAQGSGVALMGGLGYDLRLSQPGLSIKPRIGFTQVDYGSVMSGGGVTANGWKQRVLSIGAGVQWEWQ